MTQPDAIAAINNGSIAFRLVHELEGLLLGIRADGWIGPDEASRLARWLDAAEPFAVRAPFSGLVAVVRTVLADGVLSGEELEDLLFVTSKLTAVNPYYDALRGGLQQLHGVLAGMAADHAIVDTEIAALQRWVDDWSHLKGLWPYDECEALVTAAIARPADVVPAVAALLELAQQLPVGGDDPSEPLLMRGICAVNPDIQFPGRQFVFAGRSTRSSRDELERHVVKRGGRVQTHVTEDTDFLVVSTGDCPYWAFSCYGRKVEQALKLRRSGHRIVIVDERDFWDALN